MDAITIVLIFTLASMIKWAYTRNSKGVESDASNSLPDTQNAPAPEIRDFDPSHFIQGPGKIMTGDFVVQPSV
jgi:hypothetical protein